MGFFGTLAAVAAIGSISGATAKSSRLDVIDLPVGFFPEGIALAEEWKIYVGSLLGKRFRTNMRVGSLCVGRHRSDKRITM